jgi:hypothetical protein
VGLEGCSPPEGIPILDSDVVKSSVADTGSHGATFFKMIGALAGQVHTAFNNPTVCKAFSDVSNKLVQLSLVQWINNSLQCSTTSRPLDRWFLRSLLREDDHAMGDLSRGSSGGSGPSGIRRGSRPSLTLDTLANAGASCVESEGHVRRMDKAPSHARISTEERRRVGSSLDVDAKELGDLVVSYVCSICRLPATVKVIIDYSS